MAAYWWIAASVTANVAIIATEYLNRTQPSLGDAMMRTWPLIVLAQVGLYFSWHHAPTLMLAWATFALGNALMRLVMAGLFLPGEPMQWPWILAGVVAMVGGSYLIKVGMA